VDGTVELFRDSEGSKVPGVTLEVRILKVAANCDRFVGVNTLVDGVYTISCSERVDVDLEVGEGFI
jgi:hypothetical protein